MLSKIFPSRQSKPGIPFLMMCQSALVSNFSVACGYACTLLSRESGWLNDTIFTNKKDLVLPSEMAIEHVDSIIPNADRIEKAGMVNALHFALNSEDYYTKCCFSIKYLTELACFLRMSMANLMIRDEIRVAAWMISANIVKIYLRKEILTLNIQIAKVPLSKVADVDDRRMLSVNQAASMSMPLRLKEAVAEPLSEV